ncbi:MAG: uracil-DNA glycosylase [Alphaproteobacteria bacterium]|nr:uracil-DNA glycosylase [Alphaproteobacteria bacterium]
MDAPAHDCPLCPRLVTFREDNQAKFPDFHNGPVPSFGSTSSRLLIVGLAPGLKGANRTARPFTGDYAGDLLYPTLKKFGFARGNYDAHPDDGVALDDCRITNAVRCVPPQNKPVGAEVVACRPFFASELAAMTNLKVVLALGGLAHKATLATLGYTQSAFKFGHGAMHSVERDGAHLLLANSYHCSRYNTNTGRLTTQMFEDVFTAVRTHLDTAD